MSLALYLDAIKNQGTWKTDLLGSIQILGIGTAKRNWNQMKKIKYGDRANLRNKVTAKITNVYGQYQQVKSCNRDD